MASCRAASIACRRHGRRCTTTSVTRRSSKKPCDCAVTVDRIVPKLCVGTPQRTLRVWLLSGDAERPGLHSHAERGNDQVQGGLLLHEFCADIR
ncbi:hypothetical protein F6476_29530 [Pseudomonas umsongensis]|nr:hypothetical protein F6476_29530 [Pseudomonas umsongensis]